MIYSECYEIFHHIVIINTSLIRSVLSRLRIEVSVRIYLYIFFMNSNMYNRFSLQLNPLLVAAQMGVKSSHHFDASSDINKILTFTALYPNPIRAGFTPILG